MQRRRAIALALGGVACVSLVTGCTLPPECTPQMTAEECAQAVARAEAERRAKALAEEARKKAEEARKEADSLIADGKRKAQEIWDDLWGQIPKPSLPWSGQQPSEPRPAQKPGEAGPAPKPSERFLMTQAPVPLDKVSWFNWYGATTLAHGELRCAYLQLQGFHSGLDFLVKTGTQIINPINREGTVLSVDNVPYDYQAGPSNVLVDYTDFLVLYGHTKKGTTPLIDKLLKPGDPVAQSGANDAGVEHLHLEFIVREAGWKKPGPSEKPGGKPGNTRTNPVPHLSGDLRKQIDTARFDKDTFYFPKDHKWGTPDKQEDITPGHPSYWPDPDPPCPKR